MFEKYLNLEGFLEMSLKIKSPLKSTGKLLYDLEKLLNFTVIFLQSNELIYICIYILKTCRVFHPYENGGGGNPQTGFQKSCSAF